MNCSCVYQLHYTSFKAPQESRKGLELKECA